MYCLKDPFIVKKFHVRVMCVCWCVCVRECVLTSDVCSLDCRNLYASKRFETLTLFFLTRAQLLRVGPKTPAGERVI